MHNKSMLKCDELTGCDILPIKMFFLVSEKNFVGKSRPVHKYDTKVRIFPPILWRSMTDSNRE